jgi:hypothetical protein
VTAPQQKIEFLILGSSLPRHSAEREGGRHYRDGTSDHQAAEKRMSNVQ